MKNITLLFFIFFNFAFAKMSNAAVPNIAISPAFEAPKDSMLLFYIESKNLQDAELEIETLLKKSRKLANMAFTCATIFLLGIFFSIVEVYALGIFFILGGPILGLLLSMGSIAKLIRIRRLLNYFPTLEGDDNRMKRFSTAIKRAVVAGILFGLGALMLIAAVVTDFDFFDGSLPPIGLTGGLGILLFMLFDRLSFQTKNKTVK